MKKFLGLAIIFLTISCAYADELSSANSEIVTEQKEIHLDINTGHKGYKIKNPAENNDHIEPGQCEGIDLPIDMVTSPLQMLKQLNEVMYGE